jgi:4-hydroxybutyrate CoA-transferase
MSWKDIYRKKLVSVEQAANVVNPGDYIFYSIGGNAPLDVINAISRRLPELKDITFVTAISTHPFEYLMKPEYQPYFKHYTLFYYFGERGATNQESIHPHIVQFSRLEEVLKSYEEPDVMLCECAPPDDHGYFSFGCYGTFCNNLMSGMAKKIVVQVNSRTPYVYGGQNTIHVSEVDYITEADHDFVEVSPIPITDIEQKIARLLVERIEDGSTLQIGVGGLANAVCSFLECKKDLGVHTEMFADSFLDLIDKGVINGRHKTFHPGEITCTFGANSRRAKDFVNKNQFVKYYPVSYVNAPYNIAKNDNMVSINNALMVDLTGQVGSESIGFRQYSSTGGQVDFVRGASVAKNGQSFITLPSTVKGKSTIIATLPPGQIVTTLRTDVDKIATEYGVAELRNRTIHQRVNEMIKIAHPQFRDQLRFEAKKAGLLA